MELVSAASRTFSTDAQLTGNGWVGSKFCNQAEEGFDRLRMSPLTCTRMARGLVTGSSRSCQLGFDAKEILLDVRARRNASNWPMTVSGSSLSCSRNFGKKSMRFRRFSAMLVLHPVVSGQTGPFSTSWSERKTYLSA